MNEVTFMTALVVGLMAQAMGVLVGAAVVAYKVQLGSVWLHLAAAAGFLCVVAMIPPVYRLVMLGAP